jgi:GMP synthase (glutamine-hydrolysing)
MVAAGRGSGTSCTLPTRRLRKLTAMIAVVEPDPSCPPALVGAVLDDLGLGWHLVRTHAGDALPPDPDAAVVLGGRQGAYEVDAHPHLGDTKRWMADLVGRGVPVLGICLGAQLLADALGGSAHLAPEPEVGLLPLEVVGDDPLSPLLIGPWVLAHQDTFDLPPGATLLARSAYPAAFRYGSALGVQFHPEADAALAASWLQRDGGVARRAGVDVAGLVAALEDADAGLARRGRAVIAAWGASAVAERAGRV